jgi:hypothetical protein
MKGSDPEPTSTGESAMKNQHQTSELAEEPSDEAIDCRRESQWHRGELLKQRLAEYEASTESSADPLAAVLAIVASDVMQVTASIGAAIMSSGANSVEDWARIRPATNDFYRGHRQFVRYAAMERRLRESQSQAAQVGQPNHLAYPTPPAPARHRH